MPQKRSFWEELPAQLGLKNLGDLGQVLIAEGLAAVVLGLIIGSVLYIVLLLEGFFAKSFGLWLECCLIVTALFVFIALLRGVGQVVRFFRFLCRYTFNK
jgi:hypothetical protein